MSLASFVVHVTVAPLDVIEEAATPLITGGVVSGGGDVGLTVSEALFDTPLQLPETDTLVEAGTLLVDIANVALTEPTGTVTLAGTVATLGLALDDETTTPPAGAAAVSVTVP